MSEMANKVGFWLSEKKCQKFNVQELEELFRAKGYTLTKLDLTRAIAPQGPFKAIFHKLSDVMAKAEKDDPLAQQQIQFFEDYVAKHPETVIIDPLEEVRKLMDRYRQYKLIEDSELAREDGVFTPTFVELTTTDVNENLQRLSEANISFPFVCKPLVAHGSTAAHQMSLIFGKSGLKTIEPPCVAQTFINHNARLFKLFLIRDKYYVIERPSLKNFKRGDIDCETVFFDSHDISKPNCSSDLTELDDSDNVCNREPEKEMLDRIVNVVSKKFGLSLLGIDVIIDNKTGRYAIIDMNAFPGYDGVDDFLQSLCDITVDEIESRDRRKASESRKPKPTSSKPNELSATNSEPNITCLSAQADTQSRAEPNANRTTANSSDMKTSIGDKSDKTVIQKTAQNGTDFDSGIDTSDSCDEKKYKNTKQSAVKAVRRQHSRSLTNTSAVRLGDYNSI